LSSRADDAQDDSVRVREYERRYQRRRDVEIGYGGGDRRRQSVVQFEVHHGSSKLDHMVGDQGADIDDQGGATAAGRDRGQIAGRAVRPGAGCAEEGV